jgi:hypothetical protein
MPNSAARLIAGLVLVEALVRVALCLGDIYGPALTQLRVAQQHYVPNDWSVALAKDQGLDGQR